VGEPADSKLLMTNTSREPEKRKPHKPVRIILPREVCTTPEETAKLLHRTIADTLAELRAEEGDSDRREGSRKRSRHALEWAG
jgi:hypothetical protein